MWNFAKISLEAQALLGFGGGGKCAVQQISTLKGFTERRLDVILLTLPEESRFRCGRFRSHGKLGRCAASIEEQALGAAGFPSQPLNRG
jgi:hypothetical protein